MRDIKFRAWVKSQKRIIEYVFEDTDESAALGENIFKVKDCKIMQFTGVKDKNGTEIYEGDIVKLPSGSIREIVYKDAAFHVISINNDEKVSHPLYYQCILRKDGMIDFEVIGNIYIPNGQV